MRQAQTLANSSRLRQTRLESQHTCRCHPCTCPRSPSPLPTLRTVRPPRRRRLVPSPLLSYSRETFAIALIHSAPLVPSQQSSSRHTFRRRHFLSPPSSRRHVGQQHHKRWTSTQHSSQCSSGRIAAAEQRRRRCPASRQQRRGRRRASQRQPPRPAFGSKRQRRCRTRKLWWGRCRGDDATDAGNGAAHPALGAAAAAATAVLLPWCLVFARRTSAGASCRCCE